MIQRGSVFGDIPLELLIVEASGESSVAFFEGAQNSLARGQTDEACRTFAAVTVAPHIESRYKLQAWHFLRLAGRQPPEDMASEVLGVVVEVGLDDGQDVLAVYADQTAHYYNHSGAGVVWKRPDPSLDNLVEAVLDAARRIVRRIGPWENARLPAPAAGKARLNILTPLGLHFGEGPTDELDRTPMGRPLLQAATTLTMKLTSLPDGPVDPTSA